MDGGIRGSCAGCAWRSFSRFEGSDSRAGRHVDHVEAERNALSIAARSFAMCVPVLDDGPLL